MNVRIAAADRVTFFGRTGSGKTTLAKALLNSTDSRYAVLDPKHRYRDPGIPIHREFRPKDDRQIIRVDPIGGIHELELWDQVIYDIWKQGNRIIYVDEATLITPPRSITPEYGRAIRTGRERGVAVWTASQRPKELPSIIFTEAEHFLLFRLQWEDDRRKVCSFTSNNAFAPYEQMQHEGKAAKHDFLYYGVDDDRLIRIRATKTDPADSSPQAA